MDNTWVDWLNVLLLQNTMHNELFDYHCNAVVILLAKKCIFVSIPGSKVDCSKGKEYSAQYFTYDKRVVPKTHRTTGKGNLQCSS